MVEEQVRRWTLRQRGRWEPVAGRWPVVTISDEASDQGYALGRSLAERLGFSYWDRRLVVELVRLLGPDETTVAMVSEGTQTAIQAFLGDSVSDPGDTPVDYVHRIRVVIDSIVRRGGAVIVGRGVEALVAPRDALRVRLVVPLDLRRPGGQPGDTADFDIVVNSGTYEWDRAVGLVLMAYLAKFGDWPMTARCLRDAGRTGPVRLLLPRTSVGLMDERRVQNKRKFTNVVRTVVKLA